MVKLGRKQCAQTERALKEWARTQGNVYRVAEKHGIAASTLYRAINNAAADSKK